MANANLLASQAEAYKFIDKVFEVLTLSSHTILPHFIMSGATGTGKSMLIQHMANKYKLPCLSLNGAQLTPEGMQGASLSRLLQPLTKMKGKGCVVLIDEFDKVFSMHEEKSGVQQELLHMLSSQRVDVIGQFGHYDKVDTSKVLFIFAGAFRNEEHLTPDSLLNMGMEPELLGRVNLHVHVPNVDKEEILKAVDTAVLFTDYQRTMELSDTEVKVAKASVRARILEIWDSSVIGYRVIQRTIHQYFLYEGEYPSEDSTEVTDIDAIDQEFN